MHVVTCQGKEKAFVNLGSCHAQPGSRRRIPSRRWLLGRRGRKRGEGQGGHQSSQDSWNRAKSRHVRQGCWYRRYHDPLPLCPVLSNAGEWSGSGKSQQFSKAAQIAPDRLLAGSPCHPESSSTPVFARSQEVTVICW